MKWPGYNLLAFLASVFMFLPEGIFGLDGNSTFSSSLLRSTSSSPPSTTLFSTALRNQRMYDTSLQSSIIKLIRELMLTPKVYSLTNGNSVAERRADSGRVLFPGDREARSFSGGRDSRARQFTQERDSQPARSASIIVADRSQPNGPTGMRVMALTSRTIDGDDNEQQQHYTRSVGGYGGRDIASSIITRGRPGKVERVPRPIIINGNNAAINAPRYNRMIDGPAPTIGGSATAIKIPQPSVITSQPLRILEGNRDSRGRSLKEIDVQGVRVIVGQRVPDDPEDKLFTWRNGRVIKGMFFPNDPSNSRPVNQEDSNNDISKPSSFVVNTAYNF